MGFHHLALVTRDTKATHDFYTRVMGFDLAKVEVGPTPEGGWAKHFFYGIDGEGMIAFWELHGEQVPTDHPTAIADGLGLPTWTNHVAFTAHDRAELDRHRERWVAAGHDVLEVDHEWCVSIYTLDPNGIMVEFCLTTRAFSPEEHQEALHLLQDPAPPLPESAPKTTVYRAASND